MNREGPSYGKENLRFKFGLQAGAQSTQPLANQWVMADEAKWPWISTFVPEMLNPRDIHIQEALYTWK